MASSEGFEFQPGLGELVLYAYGLCGIRRPQISPEHMVDARMAANLLQVDWANEGPTLWTVELQSTTLVADQATYDVDPSIIMILDAYIQSDASTTADRKIVPVSRREYASYSDKTTSGFPSVYWFDRLVGPTLTLWKPPDDEADYVLKYYTFRQIQDADYEDGSAPEIPYRFISAFVYDLAASLSLSYAPDKTPALMAFAQEKRAKAYKQDTENVPISIIPATGGYFR